MSNLKFIQTADDSPSLYHKELDETYHSIHGAYQESVHVYVKMGLAHCKKSPMRVFEMGFGTGLNVLLAQQYAQAHGQKIELTTIEKFPLEKEVYSQLKFGTSEEGFAQLQKLHEAEWATKNVLSPYFTFQKEKGDLQNFQPTQVFDVLFYDAFGPRVQPELWELDVFEKLFSMTSAGGQLVTYCAKGQVRRNMQAAGYEVERLPGPPGKREMLRATKIGA